MAQVVEHVPSKHETLSSYPNTIKATPQNQKYQAVDLVGLKLPFMYFEYLFKSHFLSFFFSWLLGCPVHGWFKDSERFGLIVVHKNFGLFPHSLLFVIHISLYRH
jgi:hypothetical protein